MPMPKEVQGIHLAGFFPSLKMSNEAAELQLAFSRGFLLIKESNYTALEADLRAVFDFEGISIGSSHRLLVHKKLQYQSHIDAEVGIWLLGPACFTGVELSDYDSAIPEYLFKQLRRSSSDFFAALNSLSGTYALIWKDGSNVGILNDAHGLRSIFYSSKTGQCSSHLELLNVAEREGESEMQRHFKKSSYEYSYQFPGNLTSYANLLFLTPNFYLKLCDATIHRFFPREKRSYIPIHEAKRRVLQKYATLAKKYRKKYDLVMSLTGGRDSRVSFYSSVGIKDDIYYFSESRDNDLLAAKEIAEKYHLNWIGFDPRVLDNVINPSHSLIQSLLKKSVFPKHVTWSLKSQFLVFNFFSEGNRLHIHSNGAESARGRTADYEYAFLRDEYNFERFFEAYLKGCVAWLPVKVRDEQYRKMLSDQFLKDYLERYFKELDHKSFDDLGFNPWDFMYIEHRTACFLSQIHVLNQITFESTSLSNSRDVLLDMWGVEDQYIIKTSVLYNSILNEFDSSERERNFGPGYFHQPRLDLSAELRELIYSGVYIIKYLIEKKRWDDASRIIQKIFHIDPEVRYIYEYSFSIFYETKEYDLMVMHATHIMSSDRLKLIVNFNWVEVICNRLRSNGMNEVVLKLAKVFCVSEPRLHWAFKQIAHVFEASDKTIALEYVSRAYSLKNDDQWSTTLYLRLLKDCGKTNDLFATLASIASIPEKKKWQFILLAKNYRELSLFGESKKWADMGWVAFPEDEDLIALRESAPV